MLLAMACSHTPIQSSGSLSNSSYQKITPPPIAEHSQSSQKIISVQDLKSLKEWNHAANKPTFGLIPAFYQLPQSMPAGAVLIERGQIFGASYESFWLSHAETKPYAILPASIEQAQVFSQVIDYFLDAGIRLVEVSMADAQKILKAEKEAIQNHSLFFPRMQLSSGVDLLVSIQSGQGLYGPTFVGRVIRSHDGRLLALATQINAGPLSLEPLLQKLIVDALRRLAHDE